MGSRVYALEEELDPDFGDDDEELPMMRVTLCLNPSAPEESKSATNFDIPQPQTQPVVK